MPPKPPPLKPAVSAINNNNNNNKPRKRKDPPSSNNTTNPANNHAPKKHKPNHPSSSHHQHRAKQRDARSLATQTTSKAFANGALDVDKFVKAREYEIRALEQGIRRSKGALNRRAFQQVPKDLRRRGAAHDAKRVVKRLRGRARREMAEDNTPTVRKGKVVGRRGRLRVETVKKLRALGARRKEQGKGGKEGKVKHAAAAKIKEPTKVSLRKPKVKTATFAKPPLPQAKFRKRQKHKSWLPTHLFHAKRAHMTPPSTPMWRFAMPLSPTQKSYRPTHRASSERGAVCWDASYVATMGLEGEERSVLGLLRALGVEDAWLLGAKGRKWRDGTRVLETTMYEREAPHGLIAPVTVIWCVVPTTQAKEVEDTNKQQRKLFLRVHPSAFFELWEEVVRLSKVAKPAVRVEDLRFELGSIELKGPGSTEALLGALWPSTVGNDTKSRTVEETWTSLAGLTHAGRLPPGAMLGFSVQDPKLHFPPRTVKVPHTDSDDEALLALLTDWPVDASQQPPAIFDRKARQLGSKLPSPKAVNRRKPLAKPGEYPAALDNDPQIPVLLHTSSPPHANSKQHHSTSWQLLAPWKTIQPIWYSLMYYPLSTGQQPRFGGLDEQRQLAFEAGTPWFPGDFPGTKAGWDWEVVQRRRRWEDWKKRPKGKRVSWESVQLGKGKEGKGEVGLGWACEWEMLLDAPKGEGEGADAEGGVKLPRNDSEKTEADEHGSKKDTEPPAPPPPKPKTLTQIPSASALAILSNPLSIPPTNFDGKILTTRLTLLTRGVPQTCARIYRLPSAATDPSLRKAWLALRPSKQPSHKQKKSSLPRLPRDAAPHILQQRLAASLLEPPRAGEADYPACPGKDDLVGFITSGNFNLFEGKGTGVGCLLFGKVMEQAREDGERGRLCIVRNAGEGLGRLARWDVV